MEPSLREKIERIADRHEELATMLCEPEVVNDKARFLKVSREHADLNNVAEAFARYRKLEEDLEEARELLEDPDMRDLAREDVGRLDTEIAELAEELQRLLIPRDPNDSKNVVLEIRSGAGGEEAALFAAELWRMYARFAERQGWAVEGMGMSEASAGGVKDVTILIKGKDVYAKLKFEKGVHRVQRVPVTESQGRIHTSTATVAVMPEAEDVDIDLNPADIKFEKMRAGGAGGQHVNTTDSAVRLTHLPTGIAVHVQQEKSQTKNREIAMIRLRSRILQIEIDKYESERAANRRSQVGSGDRSEKVRTYNFPQDRITDHRIGLTRHNLEAFMNGDLDEVIEALRANDEAERLAEMRASVG